MIIDTGWSVTVRTWVRIASPLLGSLVSTSTTPPCVTNTVVFPPAPGITYSLSRTFLITPVGGIRGRGCGAAAPATARPTATIAGRSLLGETTIGFIGDLQFQVVTQILLKPRADGSSLAPDAEDVMKITAIV